MLLALLFHPQSAFWDKTIAINAVSDDNGARLMKNKYQVMPQAVTPKKPAKAELSDAEFRRRLKNISEWRQKRLARLRACFDIRL